MIMVITILLNTSTNKHHYGWQFGTVVTSFITSMKLLYIKPG